MTEPEVQPRVGVLGVLAFVVELAMFALLAVSGWRLGTTTWMSVLLVLLLWVVAIVVWGRWMAPRSPRRLVGPARAALATSLFVGTGALAIVAGVSPWIALALVVVGGAVFVATKDT
jgi:hypothetical protein